MTEKVKIRVDLKKKIFFSTLSTTQHIDGKSENKGRSKKKIFFFFRLYRLPNRQTDSVRAAYNILPYVSKSVGMMEEIKQGTHEEMHKMWISHQIDQRRVTGKEGIDCK